MQYIAFLAVLFAAIMQAGAFATSNSTSVNSVQNASSNSSAMSTVVTIPPTVSGGVQTFTANLLVLPAQITNITNYLLLGNLVCQINGKLGYWSYPC